MLILLIFTEEEALFTFTMATVFHQMLSLLTLLAATVVHQMSLLLILCVLLFTKQMATVFHQVLSLLTRFALQGFHRLTLTTPLYQALQVLLSVLLIRPQAPSTARQHLLPRLTRRTASSVLLFTKQMATVFHRVLSLLTRFALQGFHRLTLTTASRRKDQPPRPTTAPTCLALAGPAATPSPPTALTSSVACPPQAATQSPTVLTS